MTVSRLVLVLLTFITALVTPALVFAQPAQDETPVEDFKAPRRAGEDEVMVVAKTDKYVVVEFGPGNYADIFRAVRIHDSLLRQAGQEAGLDDPVWMKIRRIRDFKDNRERLADRCAFRTRDGKEEKWIKSDVNPPEISQVFADKRCEPHKSSVRVKPGPAGRLRLPLVRTVAAEEFVACANLRTPQESQACFCEKHALKHDLDPKATCTAALPAPQKAAGAGKEEPKAEPKPIQAPLPPVVRVVAVPDGLSLKQLVIWLCVAVAIATLLSSLLWNWRRIVDKTAALATERALRLELSDMRNKLQVTENKLADALQTKLDALNEVVELSGKKDEFMRQNANLAAQLQAVSKDKLTQDLQREIERFKLLSAQNAEHMQASARRIAELEVANETLRAMALQAKSLPAFPIEETNGSSSEEKTRLMPVMPALMAAALGQRGTDTHSQVARLEGPASRRAEQQRLKDQLAAVCGERDEAYRERDEACNERTQARGELDAFQGRYYKLVQSVVALDDAARNLVASMELDASGQDLRREELTRRYVELVILCTPKRGEGSGLAKISDLVFVQPLQAMPAQLQAEAPPITQRSGEVAIEEAHAVSQVVSFPETRQSRIERLAHDLAQECESGSFVCTMRLVTLGRRLSRCFVSLAEEAVRILASGAGDLPELVSEFSKPREFRALAVEVGLFDAHTALSLPPPPQEAANQGTALAQGG